ncbi:MAG: DUF1501 domain-containing protein [Planctomycetota bacterium]|nr:MAG: DUF1501 domain-containing protein [Planctomycetota bacterium]REJ93315.1 MAG: DUF1501 domain-containing protein [Planctomycetota bacterium]
MIRFLGRRQAQFCDGLRRRDFLQIGSLALGGLALPQLLAAEEGTRLASADASPSGTSPSGAPTTSPLSHRGVIMIYLAGGPPHQDMFDLKPQAPAEIRGEFRPIQTNVPGIEICELMPRIAGMMDKFTIIRSLKGCVDFGHTPHQIFSGVPGQGRNAWPSLGSFISRVQGAVDPAIPPFVGLSPRTRFRPWSSSGEPAWLGPKHAAFRPSEGRGMQDMLLHQDVDLARLGDRKSLLARIDSLRRELDAGGQFESFDKNTQRAFEVLSSSKLFDALDIEKADPKLRDRYGRGTREKMADGPWRLMDQFLIARRLIEAGVRCVTLAFSRWDWHSNNFKRGRQDMPMLDQGLSALVQDIHDRGLDKDITVLVWGEFGRTPQINNRGGRDHWANASFALLAGGGMRNGQVIGATDERAAVPTERPIHPQQVLATAYRNVGIDVDKVTVPDGQGRPQYLVERRDVIEELT